MRTVIVYLNVGNLDQYCLITAQIFADVLDERLGNMGSPYRGIKSVTYGWLAMYRLQASLLFANLL